MVQYFEWSDAYSVGVAVIDEEHKQIFDSINAFVSSTLDKRELNRPGLRFLELIRYMYYHFRTEEQLMTEAGYPYVGRHKIKHNELFERVLGFLHDYVAGIAVDGSDVSEFLIDWLVTHILTEDMGFREHFRQHGIS